MLSIVIPCYNEQDNLEKLFSKLILLIQTYSEEDIEIVIVDNGSTDNSNKLMKDSNLFLDKKFKFVEIKKNIGYGNGVYEGIKNSTKKNIAWIHADLQTEPSDVIEMYKLTKQKLLAGDCIIKGKRTKRSFIDVFFTTGMSVVTYLLFKKKLNDINAQPKIFNRNFLKKLKNVPLDFSFDIFFLLVAQKENLKIFEYPIVVHKRYAGEAKGGGSLKLKIKLTLRTFSYMIDLKKRGFLN
mgnify:FL=1